MNSLIILISDAELNFFSSSLHFIELIESFFLHLERLFISSS